MSNLLNNSRKKLLERGPQISPTTQFKLDDFDKERVQEERNKERKKAVHADKKITSVRVRKSTQHKLNALVNINKAESVDQLIEIMIDEYMDNNVLKEEKKQLDIIMNLFKSKEN